MHFWTDIRRCLRVTTRNHSHSSNIFQHQALNLRRYMKKVRGDSFVVVSGFVMV